MLDLVRYKIHGVRVSVLNMPPAAKALFVMLFMPLLTLASLIGILQFLGASDHTIFTCICVSACLDSMITWRLVWGIMTR